MYEDLEYEALSPHPLGSQLTLIYSLGYTLLVTNGTCVESVDCFVPIQVTTPANANLVGNGVWFLLSIE